MLRQIIFVLTITSIIVARPKEDSNRINSLELDQEHQFFLLHQPLNDQIYAEQTGKEERVKAPIEPQQTPVADQQLQQQIYQPGFQYVNTHFQYPGYDQQNFPRVQPSIIIYESSGQDQPFFLNPGNFLIPQQPGVIYRQNPQTPNGYGGYPNSSPEYNPPQDGEVELIPTNPAQVPPFKPNPSGSKPEKLETFNEGKIDLSPKSASGTDIVEGNSKIPTQQFPNRNNLKPGQRFFILNGESLYQNYPLNYPEQPNFALQPIDQSFQQLQAAPSFFQSSGQPSDFISTIPQAIFRSKLDFNKDNSDVPNGQFRFTPDNNSNFPVQNDVENDSVVINANFANADDTATSTAQQDTSGPDSKSTEPGTAQAAPGAVALAGPGGTAQAAPRATALAGKGGLAVSSPQATAVAGTKKEENNEKVNKQKQDHKNTQEPKN